MTNSQAIGLYLSTDGKGAIPMQALQAVSDHGGRIIAAFDADADGRKLAEKLTRLIPQTECVVPTQGKDWNAQLLFLRQSLRDWYRQARDLGRSPDHLNEIAQIGKDLVQTGKLPHESVWQTLSQDREAWQQQAQTVAACARNILNTVGEPQAGGGTLFAGKKYVLFAQDDQLYALAENRGVPPTEDERALLPDSILKPAPGIILKVTQGEVSTEATRVTNADAQRFEQFARRVQAQVKGDRDREPA